MTLLAAWGWFSANETIIQSALVFALLAYAIQVALRAGVSSFAAIGFWAVGAYTVGHFGQQGWSLVPMLVVAFGLSALIGLALALLLSRVRSLYLAMATVAFDLLVQIVARSWEGVTGGPLGLYGLPIRVTTLGLALIVAAVSAGLWWRERGAGRRRLEALVTDEQLARALGFDVRREHTTAFILSALLGALSGAMSASLFSTVTPDQAGFSLIITGLTMIVIGGTSSWAGPLIGALIYSWLPTWLSFLGDWRPIVQALVVLAMVLFIRDGVVGLARRAVPARGTAA